MTPVTPDLWCLQCDTHIAVAESILVDPESPAKCPICSGDLLAEEPIIHDPIPLGLSVGIIAMLARLLIRTGVLDFLQQRAEATSNKVDDVAIPIARNLIQEAAKL